MENSDRIHELIGFLLNSNGYVTAKEIAQILFVSEKTVYRLIACINKSTGSSVIMSQRGRGFKLNYKFYIQPSGHQKLGEDSLVNISPVERRNRIMKKLLLNSPQPLEESEVFAQYYVSSNVRHNDKQIIKKNLSRYQIKLISKNNFLKVCGPEENIRIALKKLINDQEIIDLKQLPLNSDFSEKYDVRFVVKEIDKINYQLQMTLPYPYNVNLFSHLYILICRLRKNGTKYLVKEKQKLSPSQHQSEIYRISKQVIKDISNYLSIKVPDVEVDYIFQYLTSSRFVSSDLNIATSSLVIKITKELIAKVSKDYNYDFTFIQERLEKHVQPLVNRLKNNIHVNNNLLEQIKMEYHDLYHIIFTDAKKIFFKYNLKGIDDNEVGYITLYFAQALEEKSYKLKVVIMCATGIGTSELLKIKVKKAFPNIDIVGITSNNDDKFNYQDVDLLISTVQVSEKIKIPRIVVSALFTKKDQKIVQEKIDEIVRKKRFEY